MSDALRVLVVASICSAVFADSKPTVPSTHQELCGRYASAVIRIDTIRSSGNRSSGTGFLVSPDGWILTAAHVVIDPQTGKVDEPISVTLTDGSVKSATQVLPIDPTVMGKDFAVLKIDGTTPKLPYIELGDIGLQNAEVGSDITIIGFPFSASAYKNYPGTVKDKFCLSGSVAFSGNTNVSFTAKNPKGPSTIDVKVDIIYFQGPSIRGLSGSPIVSNASGNVIAILTDRLTSINQSLLVIRGEATGPDFGFDGMPIKQSVRNLIDVLDSQLANGLGAGTGIEDAKVALRHAMRHWKPNK